ncbi:ABC transporter ATP-binding protein [Roseomonas sp. NAR14]|uniref:ABC transporter ATP-binding protein n=1 Tax=Roseomonas acroporae TaxID=2937791 RepID=A0A9X1Y6F2_9PROT|nr:ABC transporter ATP-binding protein [Roseomonas acroporae]MCK8783955.1 ABC transporter ATP-binding protein [Roseomonas acroporae]
MDAITPRTPPDDPVPGATDSLIQVRGLTLRVGAAAGEVNILRGLDLGVAAGEAVGIVGPSGSGKTSLLMLLAGLERPTSGVLRVAGHDLAAMDEDALARFRRDRVGIVFQAFHLVPTMTALENVAVPLEFAGRPDAFAAAELALRAVGLGHRLAHYPGQLSGGEQQRVALARACVARPPLLLADEPTGNLDRATGAQVMELLFGLRGEAREGGRTTLLLITHDEALAARCDRQVRIEDGRIVADTGRAPRDGGPAGAPGAAAAVPDAGAGKGSRGRGGAWRG